ncbi:Hsp20/alpha crystallin family protein [Neobacillus massiliamazoniensis]|uniref:Small heat shock protein n=1 Tax=Neobacillus massiliamazoniensis TaxID=1499688 RepID=A0A0U1NZ99_9BACI|nr:Hsp20/alpha crystallin family protein [Neobacillus massiliamazoniensis]CRK83306.1 small heat shock protein [Neobacillus massiliamazoniensis]
MIAKNDDSINYAEMEKWLNNYFLDPLTSYLDQTQFQIDLYETNKEWIVEAILSEYDASEITVLIEKEKLTITAMIPTPSKQSQKRIRVIEFPFQVISQKVTATFMEGILEIFISKTDGEVANNRYITLQ